MERHQVNKRDKLIAHEHGIDARGPDMPKTRKMGTEPEQSGKRKLNRIQGVQDAH